MREISDGIAPRRSQNGIKRESHEDHHRVVPAPKRWEQAMADRSSSVLTGLADRRSAVRVLGAASTAVLVALGLGSVTGEARDRGGPGNGKGKSDGKQQTRDARHAGGANQPADGPGDEPAKPVAGAGGMESVKNDTVRVQRKRRRTTKVVGDVSGPLAVNSPGVFSRAFCPGGNGKLLSGGYNVNGTPEQLENLIVVEAAPDAGVGSFTATLRRTSGSGSAAGATITAFAICKG